ncbi:MULTISPECIES: M23 family metallopeptidase [Sulfurimonas]|uniref:M23 family metallopeptidase n=1 Tax=Sulfurimonas TaxID=202746 RepID=UPI0012653ADF|nr:M23 family metallopeptidase [Sulfurimonas indica]
MDKHFTITIHDDNGVKQFNLHKFVKKAFLYAGLFLLTLGLIAVATILYLDYSVDTMQHKKDAIEHAYENLKEQNELLEETMKATRYSLLVKKQELNELSDSLAEIETLIGLKPIGDESLRERVSIAKLSSSQRATLLQLIPSGSPIEYHGITSKFGYRVHPTLLKREFHRGSDMKAKFNTPVYATADGIVEWSGYHKRSGFGKLVILEHMYGFKSYYGHLNKVVVKSGQFVKKGDLIAYSGNSGLSNGPHLHYEVRFIHRALNPFYFIKWTQQNYNEIFQKEKKVPWQSLITATSRLKVTPQIQTQQSSQQVQKSLGK